MISGDGADVAGCDAEDVGVGLAAASEIMRRDCDLRERRGYAPTKP